MEQIWRTAWISWGKWMGTATCHWERNSRRNADIWTGSSIEPSKTTKSSLTPSWIALETLIKLAFMREISIKHRWGDPVTGWTTESLDVHKPPEETGVCPLFSHEATAFSLIITETTRILVLDSILFRRDGKRRGKPFKMKIWSRH